MWECLYDTSATLNEKEKESERRDQIVFDISGSLPLIAGIETESLILLLSRKA